MPVAGHKSYHGMVRTPAIYIYMMVVSDSNARIHVIWQCQDLRHMTIMTGLGLSDGSDKWQCQDADHSMTAMPGRRSYYIAVCARTQVI